MQVKLTKDIMADNKPGYVYILTNPSFREDWVKIGKTKNMEERLKTLDNTSVPLPFVKYATLQTVKYEKAEKHVHHFIEMFTKLRIRDKREFFNVKPEQALKIFCEVAELLDDAVVVKYDENEHPIPIYPPCPDGSERTKPLKPAPRKPFDYSMVGLKDGDIIMFDPLQLLVQVKGKNKVEYKGHEYSLSGFCKAFLPATMRNSSGAYQGPKYFSHEGVTLWNLRLRDEDKM